MTEDQVLELLCGRLLELITECETLKDLVASMAMALPIEAMPPAEAAALADILAGDRT